MFGWLNREATFDGDERAVVFQVAGKVHRGHTPATDFTVDDVSAIQDPS
jgi:hypothetical protein